MKMANKNNVKNIKIPKYVNNKKSSLNKINQGKPSLNISKNSNSSSNSINNKIDTLLGKNNGKLDEIHHLPCKKHPKCSNCIHDYQIDLDKNKTALTDFILNKELNKQNSYNYPNVKLLGNSRYKHTNPLLFVEDQKNNINNKGSDLIPIPLEKFKKKIQNDEDIKEGKNLHELQRSIVMIRRRQYDNSKDKKDKKKNSIDNTDNNEIIDYLNKVKLIQRWWRKVSHKKYNNNEKNANMLSNGF